MAAVQPTQATSLASVDTEYSADSIEFSPQHPDIFVCGTYQIQQIEVAPAAQSTLSPTQDLSSLTLEDSDQPRDAETPSTDSDTDDDENLSPPTRRLGRMLLYQIGDDRKSFTELQRTDMPAILDMKWAHHPSSDGNSRIAVADAEGGVRVYTYAAKEKQLREEQVVEVASSTELCLSLDWSNLLDSTATPKIITSISSGSLALLSREDGTGDFEVEQEWRGAHDYEAWIVGWDNWMREVFYSGGDDCKLKGWDVRMPDLATFTNKRFEGGVTTIASSPHKEHMLAVGSYDATLRLFDTRSMQTPVQTLDAGGGLWRTRWHPDPARADSLLLGCMHDGFKVVNLSTTQSEVVTRFDGHTSLAYGAHWGTLRGSEGKTTLIATCSFYDHLMHLWEA